MIEPSSVSDICSASLLFILDHSLHPDGFTKQGPRPFLDGFDRFTTQDK